MPRFTQKDLDEEIIKTWEAYIKVNNRTANPKTS